MKFEESDFVFYMDITACLSLFTHISFTKKYNSHHLGKAIGGWNKRSTLLILLNTIVKSKSFSNSNAYFSLNTD